MYHDVAADDVAVSVGTLSVIAVPLTATTAVTVYLKDNMGGVGWGENIDCMRQTHAAICVTHDATMETNRRVHDVGGRVSSHLVPRLRFFFLSSLLFAPLSSVLLPFFRFPFDHVLFDVRVDYGSGALGRRREKEHSREDEDVDARHAYRSVEYPTLRRVQFVLRVVRKLTGHTYVGDGVGP